MSSVEAIKTCYMNTLLQQADNVHVGEVTRDLCNGDQVYIDIRIHFDSFKKVPVFGDQASWFAKSDTEGESPTKPRKVGSLISEDDAPKSKELEDKRSGRDVIAKDDSKVAENLQLEAPKKTSFMKDGIWIGRKEPISSMLKRQEREEQCCNSKAVENTIADVVENTTADVGSVCEVVNVESVNRDTVSEPNEAPVDHEFRMDSPSIRHGFLQEREKSSDEAGQHGIATAPAFHTDLTTCAEDEDEDKIQPNPNPQGVKLSHFTPEHLIPKSDEVADAQGQNAADPRKKTAGGLLKRSSNLAKGLLRKIGSIDRNAAKRRSADMDENGDTNDDQSRIEKLRSLLQKLGSGEEKGAQHGATVPQGNAESSDEPPSRFRKLRSFLFGRWYKM